MKVIGNSWKLKLEKDEDGNTTKYKLGSTRRKRRQKRAGLELYILTDNAIHKSYRAASYCMSSWSRSWSNERNHRIPQRRRGVKYLHGSTFKRDTRYSPMTEEDSFLIYVVRLCKASARHPSPGAPSFLNGLFHMDSCNPSLTQAAMPWSSGSYSTSYSTIRQKTPILLQLHSSQYHNRRHAPR